MHAWKLSTSEGEFRWNSYNVKGKNFLKWNEDWHNSHQIKKGEIQISLFATSKTGLQLRLQSFSYPSLISTLTSYSMLNKTKNTQIILCIKQKSHWVATVPMFLTNSIVFQLILNYWLKGIFLSTNMIDKFWLLFSSGKMASVIMKLITLV